MSPGTTGRTSGSDATTAWRLRLAGGGSFGRNPQKFIIGGVDNWINPTFEGGYVPLENAEDYLFLQTGLPLRGYNYNAAIGSRYGLFNMEFRYPLFAFLQAGPLPIGLQSIGGAMFFDAGSAWNKEQGVRRVHQGRPGERRLAGPADGHGDRRADLFPRLPGPPRRGVGLERRRVLAAEVLLLAGRGFLVRAAFDAVLGQSVGRLPSFIGNDVVGTGSGGHAVWCAFN